MPRLFISSGSTAQSLGLFCVNSPVLPTNKIVNKTLLGKARRFFTNLLLRISTACFGKLYLFFRYFSAVSTTTNNNYSVNKLVLKLV